MKIKQADKRTIKRSEITLAAYNPRRISDEARKKLKANLKRVGLLGGIVWNETTGTLVSGHQKLQIIDEVEKYNPQTRENDYQIMVDVVHLSQKEEKEQNVFMNSTTVQGEYDNDLLAALLSENDFDYNLAGLDNADINLIMTDSPLFDIADLNNELISDFDKLEQKTDEERQAANKANIEKIKAAKQITKDKMDDEAQRGDAYFVVSFSDYEAKAYFMETYGFDSSDKYIKGEVLAEKLQENL
ncbi:MAG: hypothetical protein LBS01_02395 [Prevotellaceae bacterium]|jgi:hypothetical protein|nr:hypothetical protein [Prevotellaceae bacterium]